MYAQAPQPGLGNKLWAIDDSTRISVAEGMTLYSLCRSGEVRDTLEVGLAYGFSTYFLLAALDRNGGGTHVAIDPYQVGDWNEIGLTGARRLVAGSQSLTTDSFQWIEARSEIALAALQAQGRQFELTFIDGYHRFDDVLVDFTLAARMCPIGGAIVMHDMWLPSIAAVAEFLRGNRVDFTEIDTGCQNLLALRRVAPDERDWTHFEAFQCVAPRVI